MSKGEWLFFILSLSLVLVFIHILSLRHPYNDFPIPFTPMSDLVNKPPKTIFDGFISQPYIAAVPGTFENLVVKGDHIAHSQVFVNGRETKLGCWMAFTNKCYDERHVIHVSPGDRIEVQKGYGIWASLFTAKEKE